MKLTGRRWIFAKIAYSKMKGALVRVLSLSGVFSSIHYAFFSRAFRREQRAVVAGLLTHMSHLKQDSSYFLLRRNVHRIEKGLIKPERRAIFAREYIGETVDYYSRCLDGCSTDSRPREFGWATDVLHQYFDVVGNDPLVDKARDQFMRIAPQEMGESVPYARGEVSSPVSPEDLLKLVRQRKSVRTFLQKPVARELVDRALQVARFSPSSCNRQPMHYRIFDEEPLLREVANLPLGAVGLADNIPMICALTGDLSAYFYERDRHSIYVDACLSAMLFMLALETVGLASCPLNWAEIDTLDRKFEKLVGLPPHERGILFIAIGYPDPEGLVAYSEKKGMDDLRSYNKVSRKD
ncbi:MAG: nitroreductase family protein [Kiritimatiellia bacterium]|jgi:nitroreductase|nr:nitroreductase family protein [Kiritimatiellia bacterium]MDP6847819.1 nitroreductase family protein [Kiritimatiellia bacterium]